MPVVPVLVVPVPVVLVVPIVLVVAVLVVPVVPDRIAVASLARSFYFFIRLN